MLVQKLQDGSPITGITFLLPATRRRELPHAFKSTNEYSRTESSQDDPRMTKDFKWKMENIIKFATWNVQGIGHKEDQLDDI